MARRIAALIALCFMSAFAQAEVIDINNAEFAKLAASGVPIIDIRTEAEWKDTGIVSGSKLITFFDAQGQANPPQWLTQVKTVAKANQPVILICRSGKRSVTAANFLSEQAGYTKVYNVKGGIREWIGDHQPVVPIK